MYPWGDSKNNGNFANFADANTSFKVSDSSINDGFQDTAPVGSFPNGSSPYGVEDMAGNVWEWVADRYDANYYWNSPSSNPSGPVKGVNRVLRGGSFGDTSQTLETTYRFWRSPDLHDDFIGFRCAKSAND
jgi:formylglycine-generating enzyme required for sulfatase activity